MEKAHPEIQDYFLQIFDKGETLDSRGNRAEFNRHIFIMTCNIIEKDEISAQIGFQTRSDKTHNRSAEISSFLRKYFRHEFLSRIDRIIHFESFSNNDYYELLDHHIKDITKELHKKDETKLKISEGARGYIFNLCIDQEEGARGFKRTFKQSFVVPLYKYIETKKEEREIFADCVDKKLVFRTK